MTVPVIAVVGYSDTGKTTVASSLIQALTARGYRIAAVKHGAHGHDVERPASDSARLFEAGASKVVISSPGQLTSIEKTQADTALEDVVASLGTSYDLVVAEGFKGSSVPKVLVTREGYSTPSPENVLAVIGDHKADGDMPFYAFQEMESLASLIQDQMLGGLEGPQGLKTKGVSQ